MNKSSWVRFSLAIAVAGVLAGARNVMSASNEAGFPVIPTMLHGEGDTVIVAFAATGFPEDVTYSATGLPPGLSITTGVDAQAHVVGLVTGTLPVGAGGTDPVTNPTTYTGSEGVYTVQISTNDGRTSNTFTWDVGRWGTGDVFIGSGEWSYRVYSQNGDFKYNVLMDDTESEGWTTNCADNWHTGEVWTTNHDAWMPSVSVIARHAAGGGNPLLPYTDVGRRVSTRISFPGTSWPVDANPEGIVFNNAQQMFVGHSFGLGSDDGYPLDVNGDETILDDPPGAEGWGYVYVDASGAPLIQQNGEPIPYGASVSPDGFFQRIVGETAERLLDQLGQPIPLREQHGVDIHRYDADGVSYPEASRTIFNARYGQTGIDSLDLASDQRTMIYSSESSYIYRYDVVTGTQLPVVGSVNLTDSNIISPRPIYGIRILPPGDGSGGYLALNFDQIDRLDANGNIVQSYDVQNDPDYPDNNVWGWFAVAMAPDGRSFWASTIEGGDVFRFDVASGQQIGSKIHVTDGVLHTALEVAGLCVMNEYKAAQEVCGATGLGNGLDDDADGTIDEGCFRSEICSFSHPGDDDGDGLVDYNDPDCGVPSNQQCSASGPTPNTVGGFCERENVEGEAVSVAGVPRPCSGACDGWTMNYTATGLPPGLVINSQTGDITGSPDYTIVNPNESTSPPVAHTVTVNASWQQGSGTPSTFSDTFTWTILNANRVPYAADDSGATSSGGSVTIDVRLNDSDIDADPFTVKSFTQPLHGVVVRDSVDSEKLKYTAPVGFGGVVTFTYIIEDDYTPVRGESNVATVTIIVNGPPVANNDSYTGLQDTALVVPANAGIIQNGSGHDTDPENDPISVVPGSVSAPSNGTVSVNADGSFTYTPNPSFTGVDTFTYRVADAGAESNTATVTITIRPRPVATNESYTVRMNHTLAHSDQTGLLSNGDSDPNGRPVWIAPGSLTQPANGVVSISSNGDGGFTYTPNQFFVGVDTFTYRVTNGTDESNTATTTITVYDLPTAVNDSYTTPEDTTLNASVAGNDTASYDGGNVWTLVTGTTNGTVTLGATGTFSYVPNANYNGTDQFTYKLCDAQNDCATAIASITITGVDDLPIAVDDTYTTDEDTPLNASLTGNDTPSGDGGNVWSKVTNPSNGSVTVNNDGTFTYTPNANFHGTDNFTYRLCDTDGDCVTAVATITINSVDEAPLAANDSYTTQEDTPVSSSLTGNDTPSNDGGNVWAKATDPSNGSVTVNANGTFTYTPNANFHGTDSFTYTLCDVDGDCATATATITITSVDEAPLAAADVYSTPEDTLLNGSVTGNDTPSNDGGNVWSVVTTTANGTLTFNPNGTFSYMPNANFTGVDVFTYQVCDVDGDCATAIATITITPVDDAPLASDDAFTTAEDTPVTSSVTGNDTPSGDGGNTWLLTSPASNGTVVLNTNGTFTYTPNANFFGTDTFNYKVCDIDLDCANAVVTITITPVDDAPLAVNDSYTTGEDTPLNASVTGNDTPSGDGGNVWTATSTTANGTLVFNPNGTFTYTPNANFFGTDTFNYKVCDADNDCANATVTITITSVDDAPVAVLDTYTTPEDTQLNASVTGNDTPSGDGGNVWTVVTGTLNGALTLNPNGTFTYMPNANFNGIDTFTYKVCDADGDCSIAVATITITPVDDAPLAADDTFSTPAATLLSASVTGNDNAIGDGLHTWSLLSGTSNGVLVFLPTGAFTYMPNLLFSGVDTFRYQICDSDGDCDPATVTITVVRPDDAPVAVNDSYTTPEDTALNASVAGNDTPSLDGGNVWTATSTTSNGTLVFNTNGTFTYTPNANFHGTDSFNYKVCDADGDCANAVATITITPVDDAPIAVDDSFTIAEDTTLNATVKGNDTLSGDGGNVWALATGTSNGTVTVNANGNFTYTPNANFNGTDSFTYTLCDADNDCVTAKVTITVTGTDDAPLAVNDSYTTPEDTTLNGSVTGNDTPSGDGGNVWTIVTGTTNGSVTMTAAGGFTYIPNANYTGSDSFSYKVCDADGDCANAVATITITPVDDAPVAVNDTFTTAEDSPVSGSLTGNDTPSGDGGNAWTKTSNPANGSATVNANGTFTYTPNANFNGTDTFTYQVCDVDGDCSTATVTITITAGDDVPLAVNDSYTTQTNTAVNGTAQTNDTPSPDGGNVWSITTAPTSGTVAFLTDGSFTYTPATGYSGTASFGYKVCDVDGDCANATVTIVINAVCGTGPFTTYTQGGWGASPNGNNPAMLLSNNFAAVYPAGFVQIGTSARYLKFTSAAAISVFLPAGGTAGVIAASATNPTSSAAGVFAGQVLALQLSVNFSDAGVKRGGLRNQVVASGELAGQTVGQVLALANSVIAGGALPAGLTISELNSIVDAINNNYDNGLANDGFLNDDPACNTANNVPVARDDAFSGVEDTILSASVATNDTVSVDGGNVWSLVSGPSNGVLVLTSTGAFTYTPLLNFNGSDTFTYKLCDRTPDCDTAVAVITLAPGNDVPVAVNDAFSTPINTVLSNTVTGNDTPSADGGNVWTKTSSPSSGTVVFNSTGAFTYTPTSTFSGTVSFGYKVCDVNNDCASATVTITVTSSTNGAYTTYTQGGWGATPSGNNPGQLLLSKFTTVYAAQGYVQIGSTKYLRFTSSSAVEKFLPAGGTANKLSATATNPKSSAAGVFAGQVLALQLSVDFSKAGITKTGLAGLKLKAGKLSGYTVQQVLDLANAVLGGSYTLPSTLTISELNGIIDSINKNFDNGTTNNGYLG
jgi:VCBS repeat-containing protein